MSFGDLQSMPTLVELHESPTPPTTSTTSTSTELQRLLKPLALNNAALKETTRELMSTSATTTINTTTLKRMRALRDQNRHIASAVANLLATSTDETSQQVEDEQHVELTRLLQEFQHVLSQSIQVERNIMSRNSSQNGNPNYENRQTGFDESDPLLIDIQQDDQVQAQNYDAVVDMKHVYLDERSSSLAQIQSSVDDVNSIFKELASLVNDQRSQVEYIDMNMDDSKRQIEVARRELEITRRKRSARKSLFFCTLIIIALVIAAFLIIMLT